MKQNGEIIKRAIIKPNIPPKEIISSRPPISNSNILHPLAPAPESILQPGNTGELATIPITIPIKG